MYKKIALLLVAYMLGICLLGQFTEIGQIGESVLWLMLIGVMYFKVPKKHGVGKVKYFSKIRLWAFNSAVIMIVINMLGGILLGFGKSPVSHSLKGLLINTLYIGSTIVGREWIRAYLLNCYDAKNNKRNLVFITLLMIIVQLNISSITAIANLQSGVENMAKSIMPLICENFLLSYFAIYGGSIAAIIYVGIMEAFMWYSPILPDLNWLATATVGILGPVFIIMFINGTYQRLTKQVKGEKKENIISLSITTIGAIGFIWFVVGVFPIYPSAIATGSMKPEIMPGDVVVMEKVTRIEDIEKFQVGDVIQFQKDEILINHRIIEIVEEDGQTLYRTKGDNNNVEDAELVKASEIRGHLVGVIPKVGWPTLLLKSKPDESTLEKVEF